MGSSSENGNTRGNLYSGNPLVGSKFVLVRLRDGFRSGTGFLGIVYWDERAEGVLFVNGRTLSFSCPASLLR